MPMASDYEAIERDNVRRRGEEFDDIGRLVAEQLYSDRTHFIYELLQNAEDALARRAASEARAEFPRSVTFLLRNAALEVAHYGQPFSTDDVRAICDILKGTKTNDASQIGKFGIGFKSVYAFTASPEIHSGDEHFRIERYIRPQGIPAVDLKDSQTRFLFPFNHAELRAADAFDLIGKRLQQLGPRTLLFLRNVNAIAWGMAGGTKGVYRRQTKQEGPLRRVTLTGESEGREQRESWMVFERPVHLLGESVTARVEVAYQLGRDERTGRDVIKPVAESPLVVFFPTEKDTRLGFLIQGPYRTTPARDNVIGHTHNAQLVRETAQLVVDSLQHLKDLGLLTISALREATVADPPGDTRPYARDAGQARPWQRSSPSLFGCSARPTLPLDRESELALR
jgi:hypothetical protein